MTIYIENNDGTRYINRANFRWKLISKKLYYFPIYLIVIGTFVLIQGLMSENTFSSETRNYITPKAETVIKNYDFHLSIGLGIGFLLTTLFYLYYLSNGKRHYLLSAQKEIRKGNPWHERFEITDAYIKHERNNLKYEIRWPAFEFYRISDHFIVLYVEKDVPELLLDLTLFSKEQENELLKFLPGVISFKEKKRRFRFL